MCTANLKEEGVQMQSSSPKKKTATPSFREKKEWKEKVTMITAYDYPFACLVNRSEAEQLIADAKALDEAAVFAVVLECIPIGVAKAITESVKATTIGCGAGPYVDGQNLNAYDILGLFERFVPKFVKQYKVLAPDIVDAFNPFTKETRSGAYPTPEHGFTGGEEISRLFPS